jgi:hypothetical protein
VVHLLYNPRRSAILLAIAVSGAGLLAGCGSSNSKSGTVSASQYVGQLCTSAATWLKGIEARTSTFENEIGPHTSPAEAKRVLESLVSSAVADTQTVVSSMRAAGVPEVNNGQHISSTVISSFEGITSKLAALQTQVAGLNTGPSQVHEAARSIGGSVREAPLRLGIGLAGVTSPELEKAAAESSICKSVGAKAKSA